MGIPAAYFDGKTSRKYQVELSVEAGIAAIAGDTHRQCPIGELRVSEWVKRAPRKLTFPDGAYLEVLDNAAFNALLDSTGHREPAVVRLQQSWRGAMLASLAIVATLALGYLYGLPAASEAVAKALPEKAERAIGRETLEFLDQKMLAPTTLSASRREELIRRFQALQAPKEDAPHYDIIFRKSNIGPNAFALPSGQIILTDEIVRLVEDDDAVMGILAHELGHLHERHLMRRLIQASAIGAVTATLFGDVSSILVGVPAMLLDLKYSRDAEREADRYAMNMLKTNGMSPLHLADAFDKLDKKSGKTPAYLLSHPPTAERIEQLRKAH